MAITDIANESLFHETVTKIQPIDRRMLEKAAQRQRSLTKPEGSLGRLEEVANRCAAIFDSLAFSVAKPRIVIFAGDHGVCEEGVNPFPQAVTTQMVLNFLHGGAAINCLARCCGVELKVVDVGVAGPLPELPGLTSRNVGRGTQNFCVEAAMTRQKALAALCVGIEMANEAVAEHCNLLGFGEMGIGNSTAAGAVAAALTKRPIREVVGRGTGADEDCMKRKISAVERALEVHRERLADPLDIMMNVGGLEIAAMCGFCLGAAAKRRPVLTDGFIATSAAALAARIHPDVKDYLFAAHASTEPGHIHLLELIGQRPLLSLDMRLGEGTGVALAMKLVQAAAVAFTEMATFESAGVSSAQDAALTQ
jgi:nicotinate-nucleotide--dimethylbenzimidazole phosphoribosyltransferase